MMKHIVIYREPGRYAGWPANYGIWNWEDEIVVGFTVGFHKSDEHFHARDTSKPFINRQARSLDGGQTWSIEEFPGKLRENCGLSADEHLQPELRLEYALAQEDIVNPLTTPIGFTHPNFSLMCARTGLDEGVRSFFYISYDRCHNWQGPYSLPMFGQTGIAARTSYIVEDSTSCLIFLTANKANGHEGKVFCIRTKDGGLTFETLSEIGGEPSGKHDFNIMPANLILPSGRILCAIRCRRYIPDSEKQESWIDLYASDDNGHTWDYVTRPVMFDRGHNGNPPTLNQLPDNRLVLIYGNRTAPYTIEAKLSDDDGQTWSDPIRLRDDGGNHDIGYPRTVVTPDGTLVTVYYFNEHVEGERFIEATIWKP